MARITEQLALQIIYNSPSTTRSDLGKQLGVSQATVMRLTNDLIDKGYVIECEPDSSTSSRGRPSSNISINPDYGVAIGVELGREKMYISCLSADGALLETAETSDVPEFRPSTETLDALIDIVFHQVGIMNIARDAIIAFGLAVHDLVSADGDWITWQHTLGDPFPVQKYLTEKLNIPVEVDDISRAFAVAEHRFGRGRNESDMIYLFVGKSGIGSGIFVNDQLLRSSLGICGEIGHIVVAENGDLCQCGNYGCLETVATYDAVVAHVQDRIDAGVLTSLSAIPDLAFSDICSAYIQGDKEAHVTLSKLAYDVGKALASTISIIGATHVVIGGQLRQAGDLFIDELTSVLRKQLIPGLAYRVTVAFAELPNYAGSWGIASQVLDTAWQTGAILQPAAR